MAKRGGGEWPGAITATEIDLGMDGVFADVTAARQAAKQDRIRARTAAKSSQKNPDPNLLLAIESDHQQLAQPSVPREPICRVCPDASAWLVARMMIEGAIVPVNLAEVRRPDWEKLFTISQ